MKLFIATNSETVKTDSYLLLLKTCKSAVLNTPFDVYVIFDGNKEELNGLPPEVNVIEHRHRCYDKLKQYSGEQLKIATGAFLRTEIPYLCKKLGFTDEHVLYVDYDVMFFKGDYSYLDKLKPKYFAVAPEFDMNDYINFNTGVMLMNVKTMLNEDSVVLNHIVNNLENLDTYDQSLYKNLYTDKITKLPTIYNWKPYWGKASPLIVHFHGAKPKMVEPPERYVIPIVKHLREINLNSYNYYNDIWEKI
jgi:hypothetical protein